MRELRPGGHAGGTYKGGWRRCALGAPRSSTAGCRALKSGNGPSGCCRPAPPQRRAPLSVAQMIPSQGWGVYTGTYRAPLPLPPQQRAHAPPARGPPRPSAAAERALWRRGALKDQLRVGEGARGAGARGARRRRALALRQPHAVQSYKRQELGRSVKKRARVCQGSAQRDAFKVKRERRDRAKQRETAAGAPRVRARQRAASRLHCNGAPAAALCRRRRVLVCGAARVAAHHKLAWGGGRG